MMEYRVQNITITLPRNLAEKLKNKCHFYDIPISDAASFLFDKFVNGDYDKELELPVD